MLLLVATVSACVDVNEKLMCHLTVSLQISVDLTSVFWSLCVSTGRLTR